ncbi:flagellar biosynthesis protein FlhF [Niallia taxi]|uniref:Flagellar biosynthesis protein FlhF n=1 Tax=Niallia taxi TaxID=2499688 RepID=A0A437KFQ1_9BACI|nr:flagellar biosynthesis protein FlhF [Niallia taxi]MCM3214729.1 flagellar biosynthesis protein FlhF [Niallia taxi]MDK8638630.1 flagellar biosynthesis protein FlhF [Niallia taxi]RVT67083.1 flagellar biosynthesis protein FlhF [Niallia taxi]
MKIKKYIAASMPDAMKQVRAELGNNAVILQSKIIYTGGFLGMFKKRNIEVLAAIDPDLNTSRPPQEKPMPAPIPAPKLLPKVERNLDLEVMKELQKSPVPASEEIMKQLARMNQHIQKMSESGKLQMELPIQLQTVIDSLVHQDLDVDIQSRLTAKLLERWYLAGANSPVEEVYVWAEDFLYEEMKQYNFGELPLKKKFINVIGPTGVGKTTTLAKMAAEFMMKHKKKIGFITTDTYRIAAIDQLKTYATILNVPIEVCYNLEDFDKATKSLADCDIILVDTAGRNFRNQQYVQDLKEVVDYNSDMETLLVLSLTAKQTDMEEIYQQFSSIHIDQFIFTKLDETSTYGAMVNLVVKYQKGVAYVTTGQNVPDDIMPADPRKIAKRMIEVD